MGRGASSTPNLRGAAATLAAAALLFLSGAPAGAATPRPDLRASAVSGSGSLVIGSRIAVKVTTLNAGSATAGSSVARVYLSRDGRRSSDDRRLGSASVSRLPRGAAATRTIRVTVPVTSPQAGRIIACVDDTRVVRESNELNNCRATPDGDRDGFSNFGDCAPRNPAINPGVDDRPDVPAFRDTNCDRIDGNARRAVFVSPVGDDANPGTRTRPKATFASAVDTAASLSKDVYATLGTYTEALETKSGVSVYGGYDVSWRRSLSNRTRLTGTENSFGTYAAAAIDVTAPTKLQLLRLEPSRPQAPRQGQVGGSSYGLRGTNNPGLTVERVVAIAAPGQAGWTGTAGDDGAPGQSGDDGGDSVHCSRPGLPGRGGATDRNGGRGGDGVYGSGSDGRPGSLLAPGDAQGRTGGPGGSYGFGDSAGGRGWFGESGLPGSDGAGGVGGSTQDYWVGTRGGDGNNGTPGHGGGGGGAGGSSSHGVLGGGGGGGGGGGEGGEGGAGGWPGGGSFGIFLTGENGPVKDSVASAADGAAGGRGGEGGYLGLAGAGGRGAVCDARTGGNGGPGGFGGLGGDGGGAAGGPSVAFYGLAPSETPGSTASHGAGGAGGSGPGAPGAAGETGDHR